MTGSSSPVRPRPYEQTDAAATLAVFIAAVTQTAAADYSPEQVQAWARPEQRHPANWNQAMSERNSFVATVGEEVAGFSDVHPDGHIDMLFVSPRHQRRGVARALLAEAEIQARAFGAAGLYADVSITARSFFESQGFIIEGAHHPVIAGVQLVNFRMRKRLQ